MAINKIAGDKRCYLDYANVADHVSMVLLVSLVLSLFFGCIFLNVKISSFPVCQVEKRTVVRPLGTCCTPQSYSFLGLNEERRDVSLEDDCDYVLVDDIMICAVKSCVVCTTL